MGRFFTSTQIYNPKLLDRDGFKAYFCEKMKKEGYEICEADCAELSYVLAFSENCKWVTLSSESYEQGNRTAQADTARIAKMLKTTCINTTVIDSDCAMLDLYDDKGKKADTLVMGRADDYLGDDIPAPAQAVWEKLLSPDSTWEQFMSVVQGDYVFVEDGLSELAPVIGMNSGNILFEYDDANENNKNFCYLSFRKASSKKEKKLTLNAAFKQVFGEALEPLGFQLVKGRYPYFVRVVNGEIIHIITIAKETSGLRGKKAFNIYGDIATVYRDQIDFSENPEYRIISMTSSYNLLRKAHPVAETRTDEIKELIKKNRDYYYEIDNEESLLEELKVSLKFTKQILLPYIESVSDIDAAFTYLPCGFWEKSDGLLGLKTKRYREILEKKVIEREQQYKRGLDKANYYKISNGYTQEKYEEMLQNHDEFIKKMAEPIEKILSSPELSEKYNKELERRKKYNLEMLKSYGIDSEPPQPKKEKKLTINAAFKQVFGEALEPLGFIKAKTRHPCFLRAVGDEIIHVINLSCCGTRISTNSGVMTVYRPKIDLNDHKWDNKWLYSTEKFYSKINVVSFDEKYWNENLKIEYTLDNEESLINALKKALEEVKKWVLPILNDVKTVKDIIDYQHRLSVTAQYFAVCDNVYLNHETPCSDGAILFALDDPYYYPKRVKELLQTQLDFEIEHGIHFFGKETYEETCERFDKNLAERIAQIDDVINNKHFYEQTIAELQRRKDTNLKVLHTYGIL